MNAKYTLRYQPSMSSDDQKSAELMKIAKLVSEDVKKIFQPEKQMPNRNRPSQQATKTASKRR